MTITPLSQLDPRWKNTPLPNCPPEVTIGAYGCLTTCISMLLGLSTVTELTNANPECWESSGNMNMALLLSKYGYTLKTTTINSGDPIPQKDIPIICRTSFFASKGFPTHFYIQLPQSTNIVDPASMFNPKIINRYATTTNQIREIVPIQGAQPSSPSTPSTLTTEQRLSRIESVLHLN